MVAGVLVHSASLQCVLENSLVILKWLNVFSGGSCVVMLPVQAEAWVSCSVLSVPAQCLADLPSQVSQLWTHYCTAF